MTKLGMILTSLLTAATGGAMAAVMIMAFLNFKGGWSIGTQAIAGLLFAIGAVLAVMPVGIALFGGPKAPAKAKEKAKTADEPAVAENESDGEEPVEEAEDTEFVEGEAEEDSEVVAEAEDEATVDFEPTESTGDHEFDLGDEFEEDTGKK